jgi:hypothetical protein
VLLYDRCLGDHREESGRPGCCPMPYLRIDSIRDFCGVIEWQSESIGRLEEKKLG